MKSLWKSLTIALSTILMIGLITGCSGTPAKPNTIIKHPDSAMLILSGSGTARVGLYDSERNEIVEYGTVDMSQFSGWTIHKFNWEEFIKDRR
jgi:hypothetical protein